LGSGSKLPGPFSFFRRGTELPNATTFTEWGSMQYDR
jgi:hypothetical protein